MKLRCGTCNHWIGEAPESLVFVEAVERLPGKTLRDQADRVEIRSPRDLRVCRSCQSLNVFVPLKSLDAHREAAVR